ncbi:hypothetical protein STEG23_010155 [Scotinomys teguina]
MILNNWTFGEGRIDLVLNEPRETLKSPRAKSPPHRPWNDSEIRIFLLEWEVVEQQVGYPGQTLKKKVRAIRKRLYERGLRKSWQDCLQLFCDSKLFTTDSVMIEEGSTLCFRLIQRTPTGSWATDKSGAANSQVCEELCWDFDGDCIESVDCFWYVPCIPALSKILIMKGC